MKMVHGRNMLTLASLLLLQAVALTAAVSLRQSAIISYLKDTSDPDVVPISDTSNGPLQVDINLSLSKITDVDVDRNEVEVVIWQFISWRNPAIAWDVNRNRFNETRVILPTQYLWLPDITIYNAVSSSEVLSPSLAYVSHNGTVIYVPSIRVRVSCNLENIDSNSGSTCTLKLGSWTQSSEVLSISNPVAGIDTLEYVPIPNYEVLATRSNKASLVYADYGRYEHIDFQFFIRRQPQVVAISEK